MAPSLLIRLSFEPLEEMWPQHPANLLLDLQALYFASLSAAGEERSLASAYRQERLLLRGGGDGGERQALLAEAEYLSRSAARFREQGAQPDLWFPLEEAARTLISRVVESVAELRPRLVERSERRRAAPRLRRLSMASPLDVIFSIPPEAWTGTAGGIVLFVTAVEKKFNAIERIRTERSELSADRADARAREREANVREERARQNLERLRDRADISEHELEGLPEADDAFRLRGGVLAPETDGATAPNDDETADSPLSPDDVDASQYVEDLDEDEALYGHDVPEEDSGY